MHCMYALILVDRLPSNQDKAYRVATLACGIVVCTELEVNHFALSMYLHYIQCSQ